MPRERGRKGGPRGYIGRGKGRGKGRGRGGGRGRGRGRGGMEREEFGGPQITNRRFVELDDLESDMYLPDIHIDKSMKSAAKSAGRRKYGFMDELDFTNDHRQDTLRKKLRDRPIQFVKAAEIYDPSRDLLKQLSDMKLSRNNVIISNNQIESKNEDDESEIPFTVFDNFEREIEADNTDAKIPDKVEAGRTITVTEYKEEGDVSDMETDAKTLTLGPIEFTLQSSMNGHSEIKLPRISSKPKSKEFNSLLKSFDDGKLIR
ncbi:unnamed protein product [[Candida] boidinii]|nr:unnamed protein product [[Candida] boidinii]